ncbi:hypothetical protein RchiOBHm_Chr5g0081971 [Rosa chinensis]|uniref:Uncharacterized protein n=1 Tax=Rosa chinensis TaxID=74649 RepID=A0A2P6QN56_ROSCH|nr:hypothetical protein RchiOBHm_Chr5g0081971 [Rosa chinensis]
MEYRKLKDQDENGNSAADDIKNLRGNPLSIAPTMGDGSIDQKWKHKYD